MGKYSFLLVAIVLVIAAMVNNIEWAYSKYGLGDISLCNAIRSQGMTTVLTVNMTTGGTTLSDSSDDGTSDYIYQYKVRRDLTQKVSTVTFDGTAQINSPNETSVSLETNKGTITATNQGGTTTVNASGSATTVTYLECYVACVDGNRFPAPCTPFWTRCTD